MASINPSDTPTKIKNKNNKLIKQAINLYETKQYKKALKECNSVLKKSSKSAEATSLKGLVLSAMGEEENGLRLVKAGLALNVKSHVCWHVYGLFHRNKLDYEMAIKCFANAVKIAPTNQLIIRDLSLLLLQTCEYERFLTNAMILLNLQPNNKNNWVACIISSYLTGSLDKTRDLLKNFLTTLDPQKENPYEYSELLLFGAKVHNESLPAHLYEEYLAEIKPFVLDTVYLSLESAKAKAKMGKYGEAEEILKNVLKKDPENFNAHEILCKIYGLALREKFSNSRNSAFIENDLCCDVYRYKDLVDYYKHIFTDNPNSETIACILLALIRPEDGIGFGREFFRRLFVKSADPFQSLKFLVSDDEKFPALKDALWNIYGEALRKVVGRDCELADAEKKEYDENLSLVCNYFNFEAQTMVSFGDLLKAEEAINQSLTFDPSRTSTLLISAKIHKKLRDYEQAFNLIEKARNIQLNDRYLNTIAVKAAIRAGKLFEADTILFHFLEAAKRNKKFIRDSQYVWYDKALGKYYFSVKDYRNCRKCLSFLIKYHFDMLEDQFDFHNYCFFKMTLLMHSEMLEFTKNRYCELDFVFAAKRIILCELELLREEGEGSRLENASKLVKILMKFTPGDIEAFVLAAYVFIEKEKPLLAIRALKKALEKDKNSYKLQLAIIRARLDFERILKSEQHGKIKTVIEDFSRKFLPVSVKEYLKENVEKARDLSEVIQTVRCHKIVWPNKKFDVDRLNQKSLSEDLKKRSCEFETFLRLLKGDLDQFLSEMGFVCKEII